MTERPQSRSLPEDRPFWVLDPGEQRVMFITVAGGLISIILGAVILAIALALARADNAPHSHTGHVFGWLAGIAAVSAVIAGVANPRRGKHPRAKRLVRRVAGGLFILVWLLQMLVAIGWATGVK